MESATKIKTFGDWRDEVNGRLQEIYCIIIEDAGEGALAAESINEIVAILGSDFRRKLKPLAESRWAHDPFARGSYSHALPGHADKRAVLAAPVDGRLFFAGEATSPNFFSTAHGARDSGERAAGEVVALVAG